MDDRWLAAWSAGVDWIELSYDALSPSYTVLYSASIHALIFTVAVLRRQMQRFSSACGEI